MSTFPFYFVEIYEVDVWIIFIEMYNDNSYILSSYIYDIDVCVLFDEIYAVKRNNLLYIGMSNYYCLVPYAVVYYMINNSVQQEYFYYIVQYFTVIKDKVNK